MCSLFPSGNINNSRREIEGKIGVKETIKFGIIADIQYCDCGTRGSRFYRNSLQKLEKSIDDFNKEEVRFIVNLGDLVDRDTPRNLDSVLVRLGKSNVPVYNLTGNHDYDNVTNNDQLYKQLDMPGEYYAIREDNWCFIMLNTNEVSSYANVEGTSKEVELAKMLQKIKDEKLPNGASYNGGVSKRQIQWLKSELEKSQQDSVNTLIFSHHPIYGAEGLTALNDLEITELLSRYPTVKGVISGHHHPSAFGVYKDIPFITTAGMIETETENAYGMVTIYPDKIELEGKGRTQSHSISLKKD